MYRGIFLVVYNTYKNIKKRSLILIGQTEIIHLQRKKDIEKETEKEIEKETEKEIEKELEERI